MLRFVAYAVFVVMCLSALIWPVFDLVAARSPVLVFGLPFSLVWNVGWVVLSFFALLAFHATDSDG